MREAITVVAADVAQGRTAAEQFAVAAETHQQRAAACWQADALRILQEVLVVMVERLG